MGAAFSPFGGVAACRAWQNAPIVARRLSDDDTRRSAAGRWVLILFVLGALGMLGTAAYGLAHGQNGQRDTLERRFQGRAQLGAALVGSLFSASAPAQQQQAAQRFGDKIDTAALDKQVTSGGSTFIAVTDANGKVLGASSGTNRSRLESDLRRGPMFFRRALMSNNYGLSGIQPDGTVLTALPFKAKSGTRVQISGVRAGLLAAFLGGTLKQVSNNASSSALIVDDQGGVVSEQGRGEQAGKPLRDAGLKAAIASKTSDGTLAEDRLYTTQPVGSTGWQLVLVADKSAVLDPVSGTNKWLPWLILIIGATALAAVGVLLRRALNATEQARVTAVELERSNADLERFAYVASHDLSEPLRTIGGFGGLLERRYGDRLDEEGRMMLGHITGGAARLQALIDGLLSYARVSTAPRKLERVDLEELTHEVLTAIRPAINDRNATVEVQPLPTVEGERGQLAQLLQNLILNAIKFTDDSVTPQVEISAQSIHDGRWEIRVADNGVGIAPEQAQRIFEMFQRGTADRTRSGTGIGLALCARIVERHEGHIRVEPREGGGSVFAFDLPGAPGAPTPAPRSEERVLAG
jgi:signal transduction histidine kinase